MYLKFATANALGTNTSKHNQGSQFQNIEGETRLISTIWREEGSVITRYS
jgi:hypothetical protein